MLYFLVLLSFLSVSFAASDEKPRVRLSEATLKVVMDAASECIKETGVNQDIFDNFFKLKYENNDDMKKFMYCVCHKTNYADAEGHFTDKVMTLFEGSAQKDEVQKIIDNCNNIKEKDNLETMFQTFTCTFKNSPVLLSV